MFYFNKITNKIVYLVENIIFFFSIFWISLFVFSFLTKIDVWIVDKMNFFKTNQTLNYKKNVSWCWILQNKLKMVQQ